MLLMANNVEDYLLVIWEHLEAFGRVLEKDISKRLKISAATASEYLSKLTEQGLISRNGRDILLTQKGVRRTVPLVRMHRVVEVFSYKILEVPWEDVHASVMELEHHFKGERGEKLFKNIGSPDACPHGNPVMPTTVQKEISASEAPEGSYLIVRTANEEEDFLKELSSLGIFPGSRISLVNGDEIEIDSDYGTMKLDKYRSLALRVSKIA